MPEKCTFVPYSRSKNYFNHFTQDAFKPSEKVIALRWNRQNTGAKTIIKYYEIQSMFKWVFQNKYFGGEVTTPDNRIGITEYQIERIKKIYLSVREREFRTLDEYYESLRRMKEIERDEMEPNIPEDIADVGLAERLLTIDRTYSESKHELLSLHAMYEMQFKVSEQLDTALQAYNRRAITNMSWESWTQRQGVSVHDPATLSSVKTDIKRQIKELRNNTISMFTDAIETRMNDLHQLEIEISLEETKWVDDVLYVAYRKTGNTGNVIFEPLFKFILVLNQSI